MIDTSGNRAHVISKSVSNTLLTPSIFNVRAVLVILFPDAIKAYFAIARINPTSFPSTLHRSNFSLVRILYCVSNDNIWSAIALDDGVVVNNVSPITLLVELLVEYIIRHKQIQFF